MDYRKTLLKLGKMCHPKKSRVLIKSNRKVELCQIPFITTFLGRCFELITCSVLFIEDIVTSGALGSYVPGTASSKSLAFTSLKSIKY